LFDPPKNYVRPALHWTDISHMTRLGVNASILPGYVEAKGRVRDASAVLIPGTVSEKPVWPSFSIF